MYEIDCSCTRQKHTYGATLAKRKFNNSSFHSSITLTSLTCYNFQYKTALPFTFLVPHSGIKI